MARLATPIEEPPTDSAPDAALQHKQWRSQQRLSRALAEIERILADAGFDRGPWLAVAFASGVAAWFGVPTHWHWLGLVAACLGVALLARILRGLNTYPFLRSAVIWGPLLVAAGCLTVWSKSVAVGQEPIERPVFTMLTARVLERDERPAEERTRLVVAVRNDQGIAQRIRLNVPSENDDLRAVPGSLLKVQARLMPPASPMLPGSYNFARTAWFAGLSATGSAVGTVVVLEQGDSNDFFADLRVRLARHVRDQLEGSTGGIAAALAAGDRGGIEAADDEAMRDAGLSHLLSISGLHVSALIAATYFVAMRLLALWSWLALRFRLPVVCAALGAFAGIGYTLLTGAEVPTVRSCIGAVLVLIALAMGREALSMRMLAIAAFFVLLLWPESLVGPSFQMSFSAVMALIVVARAEPLRRFLGPREEGMAARGLRYLAMLFISSVLIELVLMPIALFHFHRGGVYGSVANLVAIPLTTLVTMPVIAIALLLDLAGAGAPAWWIAGKAIELMLAIAHWVAGQPGAVSTMPAMGSGSFMLFVAGWLWFALWQGKVRWLGLLPASVGALLLLTLRPPDILVSGDGRHVGITGQGNGELLVLRDSKSSFARDNLVELAGMSGVTGTIADWRAARCSRDFCVVALSRGEQTWHILIARSRERVPERSLAAACARADIVIADRWLPRSCQPRWIKADRSMLDQTGGLAIDLERKEYETVADSQGEHGWWRGGSDRNYSRTAPPRSGEAGTRPHQ